MVQHYSYISPGINSELESLTLEELTEHYLTHYRNFLFEEYLLEHYICRIVSYPNIGSNQKGVKLLIHALKKYIQLDPFYEPILGLYCNVFPDNRFTRLLETLKAHQSDNNLLLEIEQEIKNEEYKKCYGLLIQELKKNPANLHIANLLAELSIQCDYDLKVLFKLAEIPQEYMEDFKVRCAYLYSKHLKHEQALDFWKQIDPAKLQGNEMLCTNLGLSYLACGDREKAMQMLKQSLTYAPSQHPVRLLLGELEHPFIADENALQGKNISICLYSYNKGELLGETLESLCNSQIGDSKVFVLLNGCKDNSREIVNSMCAKYPDIPIEIFETPVNIGAPAARNYLVNHVMTHRNDDYVAFLDDDVSIPENWLKALTTAIESDPEAGTVGCRALNPEDLSIQYLFRDISISKPGVIRLSFNAPIWTLDNGLYNVCRETDSVIGCCHLIKRECLEKVPEFDISFSPSQLDDIAFNLDLRLLGYKVLYLGQLACIHKRSTGFLKGKGKKTSFGNSFGNDVKFYYRFEPSMEKMSAWQKERNAPLTL